MEKNAHLKLTNTYLYKRMLNIPRIVLLFLCVSFTVPSLAETTTMQLPQLSLSLNNVTIREVFNIIEKNTEYVFIFSDELLTDLNGKVSIHVNKQTLDKILDKVLQSTGLTYKITNRQVTVSKKSQAVVQKTSLKVTGHVSDEKGEPLIGVNIQEEGTNNVVVTDMNGNFSMYNISGPSSVLKFTYIGFIPLRVVVGKQTNLSVKLESDVKGLEEVVVVGYGSQKRESVIGAITTMKPAALQINQSRSVTNALAGQVAGIIAVQRSGEPGNDASDFWIRGISSFGSGTTPLVLVDGIERSLSNLSPEEIESFSVLKDATATAVYGVKGANGVILIQTKRGQIGKPRIQIKADYGFSAPTMLPEFVDGAKYMEVMNVASQFSSGKDMYTQAAINATRNGTDPDLYPNVNWLKAVTKDYVPSGRVSLDINGGSERLRYSLILAYYCEKGMTVTDPGVEYDASNKLSRYNIRTNLDMNLTPSTEINVSLGGYILNQRTPGYTTSSDENPRTPFTDIIKLAFKNTPIVHPVIYSNGQIPANTSQTNPWAAATHSGFISSYISSLQSVFAVTQDIGKLWHPLKGLKAKATFSFDTYAWNSFLRTKKQTTYMATGRDADGNLLTSVTNEGDDYLKYSKEAGGNRTMYMEGQLSYSRLLADAHQIDGLLLYNMRDYVDADATSAINSLPHRTQGIAARLSYSYKGRYFIEGNFGYNGSENFSKGHKWGFFPSLAGGWLVTNEKFMESTASVLSKLKIRGSYGLVGNDQLSGRRFAFLSTITSGTGYVYGTSGNQTINGRFEGDFGIEDLSWETVKKTDIGIEIGLWDCINIQADYFHEKREDIFMQRKTIPETAGFNKNPWANFGIVKNQGFDASLEMNKSFGKDFFLSLRGNFTFSRNKILEYDESEAMKQTTRARTGNPLNTYYGLKAVGLFQEEDFKADGTLVDGIPNHTFEQVKPGDIRYEDTNHDGKVDTYDYQPIGRPSVPEIVYGFGFSARWKSFDFSAFFQGSTNVSNMIQGDMLIPGSGGGGLGNIYANCDDRWDPNDPYRQVFWPRLSTNKSSNNMQYSTWWLKDASYLRLKNVEVGYTFPKKWQKAAMMRDARIFFRGSNLLTWAAFDMWDPEIGSNDGMKYPLMKVYSFGFQVTF